MLHSCCGSHHPGPLCKFAHAACTHAYRRRLVNPLPTTNPDNLRWISQPVNANEMPKKHKANLLIRLHNIPRSYNAVIGY
jgi:hypothetical protein